MTSASRLRLLILSLASILLVSGCYSFAEPSFHPGDARDIVAAMTRQGLLVSEPIAGQTACSDPGMVANSLYLTARVSEADQPRDVYVHIYREKRWAESKAEVDACQAAYAAAHPDAVITRIDIPTYRVFGADWSDELTRDLRAALEEAAQAG